MNVEYEEDGKVKIPDGYRYFSFTDKKAPGTMRIFRALAKTRKERKWEQVDSKKLGYIGYDEDRWLHIGPKEIEPVNLTGFDFYKKSYSP